MTPYEASELADAIQVAAQALVKERFPEGTYQATALWSTDGSVIQVTLRKVEP